MKTRSTIPLVDVRDAAIRDRRMLERAFRESLLNGQFVGGASIAKFESDWAAYLGAEHVVGVSSGTSAIHLALAALGIGAGDVVVVPSHTFAATIEPILLLGAVPRFADIDPSTGCIDPKLLQPLLEGAKALIAVHMHGNVAPIDEIVGIASRANVRVIEDAAQCAGGRRGRLVAGTVADAGCFSFFPSKNLGALGDAGAIATNHRSIASKARSLRDHGRASKYLHDAVGYSYRMDSIQAAFLSSRVQRLDDDNSRRRAIAAQYRANLSSELQLLAVMPSVFHHYVVLSEQRDQLAQHLGEAGIETGIHYPVPLHNQEPYKAYSRVLEHTDHFAKRCLSLPIYPALPPRQVRFIIERVNQFFRKGTSR